MKKTASGIERKGVERGYGNWWNSFYELIASTATANPDLIEEPSVPTSEGTSDDLSDMGIEAVIAHVDQDAEIDNVQGHPPIVIHFYDFIASIIYHFQQPYEKNRNVRKR